jgi:hypothetical protein
MNLSVHKAMLYCALRRAASRRGQRRGEDLLAAFHPLWLGNWLTDMNQATAFFDAAQGKVDPYDRWNGNGTYKLPDVVRSNAETWTKLYQSLWAEEWRVMSAQSAFAGLGASAARPESADDIGGYDPWDHGDVVDRLDAAGNPILDEHLEFEPASQTGMTLTASRMIFTHCVERWLRPAFVTAPNLRARDVRSLRVLGHATHVLQDFFGHSNYVELVLQLAASRGHLPSDCAELIQSEEFGTFTAYQQDADPGRTFVMTGRFDRIDLVASLLEIYREALVPTRGDLADGGFVPGKASSHTDLVFEVLFDTFSNTPFEKPLSAMKALVDIQNFVSDLGSAVQAGLIRTFGWVARFFADDAAAKAGIRDVEDLAVVASSTPANDYARVGRLLYVEHVIDQKLREELRQATGPKLPHHALINKDRDVADPEGRLVHKLACCHATDITADVLGLYFSGARLDDVVPVLERYYRHPRNFVDAPAFRASLRTAIDRMYGIRWWQCADDDADRIALA